jgi:hypothetical protein
MPFGSVKYTERMKPWSTTSVTSEPAASRRFRSISSACSSGTSNERWSSWMARSDGPPAGLAKVSAPATSKNATVLPGAISKK